jgi:hypothetical protein
MIHGRAVTPAGSAPKRASLVLAFSLLALALPCLGHGGSSPVPFPRLTRLELTLRVNYDSGEISGTATLTLKNVSDLPLRRIPLLLNRLMRVAAVRGSEGRPALARQHVVAFTDDARFQVNQVDVDLPVRLRPGETLRLQLDYGGFLAGYTETGMLYVRDHVERAFTVLREDALAFPVIGLPSWQANRAVPRAPFSFEVTATVPEGLVVATGGLQFAPERADGLVTWRSRSRAPAPFLAVAIAPYRVIAAGGLRVFSFADDAAGADVVLQSGGRAARTLEGIFGPLAQPLALNVMEIPEGWGSQASASGGIIQDAAAFRDPAQLPLLYHELSHLWNAEDLDVPSPRWNEGLARFLQGRLARELDGWEGEPAALQQVATRLLEQCSDQPCGKVPLRGFGKAGLTDFSYTVGQLMFAALYQALGEERFDLALRRHFQAHQVAGTRTDDLVASFVAVGGAVAQRIFDDWLESDRWLGLLREAPSVQAILERYR